MQDHLALRDSARSIWVYVVCTNNKRDMLFQNFRISVRGSIRRPPHVLTWVSALAKTREDPAVVIKAWNARSSRAGQLLWAKAVAVRQILSYMPKTTLRLALEHINKVGWEASVLTDDVLGSKNIYPGFSWRPSAKEWHARLKVTSESSDILFAYMINKHTSARQKVKPTRLSWEEAQLPTPHSTSS